MNSRLLEQIDRAHDHVLDGGDGRHIGLEAAGRTGQVDHVLGWIHMRKRYVSVRSGVRMAGKITPLRIAGVHADLLDRYPFLQVRLEQRPKRSSHGLRAEDRILAPVGAAIRSARGFGVRQVLHQQLRARALGRHARRAHRHSGKQAHVLLPACSAARMDCTSLRTKLDARLKRISFSVNSRDSRSRLTLLPSFFTGNPATSKACGLPPPRADRNSDWKSMSLVLYPGVSALAMLEATTFWRALSRSM